MTYQEAVEYILGIPKFTKKNTPGHTREFLRYLGEPLHGKKVIHVAGTNGKGSVCVYLEAMLRAEGKTTGLFVSPHLVKINERIRIDGKPICDTGFLRLFENVREKIGEMQRQGLPHPTFFEFLFGMAVLAFFDAGVEYVILETGLGGRLDATNAVEHPLYSVLTSIGMDHREILGDTLEKIAAEKAGILKPGVPVFYTDGEEISNQVIEKRAAQLEISCKKIGKNAFENLEIAHKKIAFFCTNAYYGTTVWQLHNTGLYQAENAILAMEVMRDLFGEKGHPSLWREALAGLTWPGRMEEVLPDVFVDGAHNVSAVERFVQSVCAGKEKGMRTAVLFSAVQEKEYEKMIACLCRNLEADFYMVTCLPGKRAVAAEKLKEVFGRYTDRPVLKKESLQEAWNYMLAHQEGRTIYCLGSLYLAGALKAIGQEESAC
ncbi:MAG: bifunctional folylpolyglutamate synthase/dihydrofolate synthase [Ruminococcus sp.]|nr:bifunctional folylpolyglutamate synthase/dihydrofolate synthase [Ruminococcus sp.]